MYGKGIAKGLAVTFKRFAMAFIDEWTYMGKRYLTGGQIINQELLDKDWPT